jgi:hypothetical protein
MSKVGNYELAGRRYFVRDDRREDLICSVVSVPF